MLINPRVEIGIGEPKFVRSLGWDLGHQEEWVHSVTTQDFIKFWGNFFCFCFA
jgi:hypothetical protein